MTSMRTGMISGTDCSVNSFSMKLEKEKTIDGTDRCPECGSTNIFIDRTLGERICGACGLVIDNGIIDEGPDWRNFGSDSGKDRSHTGGKKQVAVHDGGLPTIIGKNDKGVTKENKILFTRLRRLHEWTRVKNATDRNLTVAFKELDRVVAVMGLPQSIRDSAAAIYRKAVKKKLVRGRTIKGVVAASVYAACRQYNVPRTLDEISEATDVWRKEIGRTYRIMTRELRLDLKPTNPRDYVQRFCSELNLSTEVQSMTLEIIGEATREEITSGKGPTGVAAAAIYIASILCNKRRTQRDIADVAGVTEVTIRNRYRELAEKLGYQVQA